MSRWKLVERAEGDLLDIYLFGLKRFGRRQSVNYIADLEHVFDLLSENPRMGRLAPRIGTNVRRHEHEAHVILYEEAEDGVTVLAVVGSSAMRSLRV